MTVDDLNICVYLHRGGIEGIRFRRGYSRITPGIKHPPRDGNNRNQLREGVHMSARNQYSRQFNSLAHISQYQVNHRNFTPSTSVVPYCTATSVGSSFSPFYLKNSNSS